MFRWSYIVPRLIIMLSVCLFFHYGCAPLIKYMLVTSAQSALGAKVDIGEVRASLVQGDFYLADLQIADPRNPSQNLFAAKHALLNVDRDALLHRKYVIDEGRISGLKFHSERQTDGSLPTSETRDEERTSKIAGHLKQLGNAWLERFLTQTQEQLQDEFATVRVTEELMRRWPQEYQKLNDDVVQWQQDLENLKRVYDELQVNPLRGVDYYQQRLSDLQHVQEELTRIRQASTRIRQQLETDRTALRHAKEQDEAKVRELLQAENLAPEQLSQFLLGDEVANQINQALVWVARGREVLQVANAKPDNTSQRVTGMVIPFATQSSPDALIRMLTFDGTTTHQQRPVSFQGTLRNATTHPRIHQQPARLSLTTKGAMEMQLEATFDRTGPHAVDRFAVTCPNLAQPERVLGSPDKLAVTVAPGRSLVAIQLEVSGEECEGTLTFQQDDVRLAAEVADGLGGARVAERINGALFSVNSLQTQVHLSGKLRHPSVQLDSNLGPALATGINAALAQEVEHQRDQLVAQANERLSRATMRFEKYVHLQQQQLLNKLEIGQTQLGEFQTLFAERLGGNRALSAKRLLENPAGIKNLFQ